MFCYIYIFFFTIVKYWQLWCTLKRFFRFFSYFKELLELLFTSLGSQLSFRHYVARSYLKRKPSKTETRSQIQIYTDIWTKSQVPATLKELWKAVNYFLCFSLTELGFCHWQSRVLTTAPSVWEAGPGFSVLAHA